MHTGDMDFFVLGGGADIEKRAGGAGLAECIQLGWCDGFHGRNIKGNAAASSKECGWEILGDFISFFIEIDEGPCLDTSHMPAGLKETAPETSALSELEVESIEMFIGFFKLIGLQKSIGEIYGVLFVSPRALSMEEIIDRLGISLGAASQGLKVLRSVGAVKAVYVPGERRDHFAADLELSKFATAFIKEDLQPRLDRALQRIETMESLAEEMSPMDRAAAEERLEKLKHWLERGEKMLPWILKFLVH